MQYQYFNTGDQIWTSQRFGKRTTVKLITHDGLAWEEGETGTRKLTGMERALHRVVVFWIKTLYKVWV